MSRIKKGTPDHPRRNEQGEISLEKGTVGVILAGLALVPGVDVAAIGDSMVNDSNNHDRAAIVLEDHKATDPDTITFTTSDGREAIVTMPKGINERTLTSRREARELGGNYISPTNDTGKAVVKFLIQAINDQGTWGDTAGFTAVNDPTTREKALNWCNDPGDIGDGIDEGWFRHINDRVILELYEQGMLTETDLEDIAAKFKLANTAVDAGSIGHEVNQAALRDFLRDLVVRKIEQPKE